MRHAAVTIGQGIWIDGSADGYVDINVPNQRIRVNDVYLDDVISALLYVRREYRKPRQPQMTDR